MNDGELVRRDKRIALRQAATLVDSAGKSYPAVLTDLSSAGFRVECRQLLRIGEYVVVQSGRDRPQRGQIRWADGHTAGGVFLEPVLTPGSTSAIRHPHAGQDKTPRRRT